MGSYTLLVNYSCYIAGSCVALLALQKMSMPTRGNSPSWSKEGLTIDVVMLLQGLTRSDVTVVLEMIYHSG